jgi:hypothetical protein
LHVTTEQPFYIHSQGVGVGGEEGEALCDLAAARADYEARWAALEARLQQSSNSGGGGGGGELLRLDMQGVAWPLPNGVAYTPDNLQAVLLYGVQVCVCVCGGGRVAMGSR